jgi:hypothetical protein
MSENENDPVLNIDEVRQNYLFINKIYQRMRRHGANIKLISGRKRKSDSHKKRVHDAWEANRKKVLMEERIRLGIPMSATGRKIQGRRLEEGKKTKVKVTFNI